MKEQIDILEQTVSSDYKYGFVTDIDTDIVPKGLNEDVIRLISSKKNEPKWLLDWRLKAYAHWLKMEEPSWPNVHYPPINYQDIIYYAAPRTGTPCIERPSTPITLLGQEPHFERLPWPCNIVTFDPRKGAGPEQSPTKTNQNHTHRTDRRRRRRFGRHGVWGGDPS